MKMMCEADDKIDTIKVSGYIGYREVILTLSYIQEDMFDEKIDTDMYSKIVLNKIKEGLKEWLTPTSVPDDFNDYIAAHVKAGLIDTEDLLDIILKSQPKRKKKKKRFKNNILEFKRKLNTYMDTYKEASL